MAGKADYLGFTRAEQDRQPMLLADHGTSRPQVLKADEIAGGQFLRQIESD